LFGLDLEKQLYSEIEKLIKAGVNNFLVGLHSQFDALSYYVLKKLKAKYQISVCVVFTSMYSTKKDKFGQSQMDYYKDVETKIYDLSNVPYPFRIIETNKKMIDECDYVICYLSRQTYGGTYRAVNYAKSHKKHIINLYEKSA
jgi:uncharacterized phage-like protein YoqJ